jgi:PAB1-binding protein PBP1
MKRTVTTLTVGAGIALAGLLIPALGASASTQQTVHEPTPANVPSFSAIQNTPAHQYSWATGFDSGSTGPSSITENFFIESQSLKDRTGSAEDNHSITETFVRDAAGNAFEFGISSDGANPTTRPTLFTTAWTAGNFDGYEAGFVSSTSVKPGSFNPPTGTSPEFGYSIADGNVWFTYGGKRFGYIRGSYWPGGFRAVTETQTYGEVYNNSPGGSRIPTMNGSVSNYRTNTGSRLNRYGVSSPYRITHATETGFTFSG